VKVKNEVSAGGVIYRQVGDAIEIAITVHADLSGRRVWSLPKGLIEADEDPPTTALREVREETGLQGRIVAKLGENTYWFYDQARVRKTVHFFLLECTGGDTDAHDWEVEEVRWLPLAEARSVLSYSGEREIVEKAEQMLASQ
jgi:8-oxo-dGTP pyrophosphatase MutT (NUDIX family)